MILPNDKKPLVIDRKTDAPLVRVHTPEEYMHLKGIMPEDVEYIEATIRDLQARQLEVYLGGGLVNEALFGQSSVREGRGDVDMLAVGEDPKLSSLVTEFVHIAETKGRYTPEKGVSFIVEDNRKKQAYFYFSINERFMLIPEQKGLWNQIWNNPRTIDLSFLSKSKFEEFLSHSPESESESQ